jgi:hypothetical protein
MTDNGKRTDSRKWGVIIVTVALTFVVSAALGWWSVALAVLFFSGRMVVSIGMLCFIAWATNSGAKSR